MHPSSHLTGGVSVYGKTSKAAMLHGAHAWLAPRRWDCWLPTPCPARPCRLCRLLLPLQPSTALLTGVGRLEPQQLRAQPMAGRRAAWAALLGGLAALRLALGATTERPPPELPSTELDATASDVAELLDALNRTQGSETKSITITLLGGRRRPLRQLPRLICAPLSGKTASLGIQASSLLSSCTSCLHDRRCQAPHQRLLSRRHIATHTSALHQTPACLPACRR